MAVAISLTSPLTRLTSLKDATAGYPGGKVAPSRDLAVVQNTIPRRQKRSDRCQKALRAALPHVGYLIVGEGCHHGRVAATSPSADATSPSADAISTAGRGFLPRQRHQVKR